ncbi:hypothetical protein [Streptomyces sp. NPDC017529]
MGDGNRKTLLIASIRDDGIAYGAVQDKPTASKSVTVVQPDLRSCSRS